MRRLIVALTVVATVVAIPSTATASGEPGDPFDIVCKASHGLYCCWIGGLPDDPWIFCYA